MHRGTECPPCVRVVTAVFAVLLCGFDFLPGSLVSNGMHRDSFYATVSFVITGFLISLGQLIAPDWRGPRI